MDKLHREHDFVQNMWKFMKACEQKTQKDESFWEWAEEQGTKLEHDYNNMSFVPEWIASFLKFLDEEAEA